MSQLSNLDRITLIVSSISIISVIGISCIIAFVFFVVAAAKLFLILINMLPSISKQIKKALKENKEPNNLNKKEGTQEQRMEECEIDDVDEQDKMQKENMEKQDQNLMSVGKRQGRVSMADLYKIRSNLKKAFMVDDFLIVEDEVIVITPGIKIIEKLGGISAWVLHKSKFGRGRIQRQDSGEDTETQSNPQNVDDQQLKIGILPILKSHKKYKDHRQKALEIYNMISAKYSHYSVTIILKQGYIKGVWTSIADFRYKEIEEDQEILILLT